MDAYQHQNFSTHLKSTLKGWSDAKERPESSAGTLCFPSFIGSRRAKKPRGCKEAALTIPAEPRARYSPPNTASNYFSAHNKCPGRPQDTCQCPRRLSLHLTQGEATRTVWGARSHCRELSKLTQLARHTVCSYWKTKFTLKHLLLQSWWNHLLSQLAVRIAQIFLSCNLIRGHLNTRR